MTVMELGGGLELPLDVVTRRTAVVGQTDTGKTSTAVVFVEEARAKGAQVVVIDPSGAWWGIASSADGERAGVDVVVMGGQHGEVPLNEHAGRAVARLVAKQGYSPVLDLDRPHFTSWGGRQRFVADFLSELYELADSQILVVVDEAHRFAPQTVRDEADGHAARCLGAFVDVVALGRRRGLGVIAITQRLAKLHKDVLELCEIMVAHRLRGNNDRAALKGWLDQVGEDIKAVMAEVAQLEKGVARVSAPTVGIEGVYRIRRKQTFDSSASIGVGEAALQPKARAEVDVDALRRLMAETIEQEAADDPDRLRARISELEDKLARAQAGDEAAIDFAGDRLEELERELAVEREHTTARVDELEHELARAQARFQVLALLRMRVGEALERVDDELARADEVARTDAELDSPSVAPLPPPAAAKKLRRNASPSEEGLKAGARRMLEVLGRYHPRRLTRNELATLANVTKGGTFTDYLSSLRAAGRITETDDGITLASAAIAPIDAEPFTPAEVVALHRPKLKAGAQRMLDHLVRAHPDGYTRTELAGLANVTKGGTFSDYLSSLRRRGLTVERNRRVYASDTLFIGQEAA